MEATLALTPALSPGGGGQGEGGCENKLRQTPPAAALSRRSKAKTHDGLQETGSAGNQGFAGFSDASQRSWREWRTQFRMGTRVRIKPVRSVALYLCR